jgi:hypothetical protein
MTNDQIELAAETARISDVDDNLTELARSLGYYWPDDDASRWRVLTLMAQSASYWRSEAQQFYHESNEAWHEFERQKFIEHKNKRIHALTIKLKNVRRALRDYMAGQAAYIREAKAELAMNRGK